MQKNSRCTVVKLKLFFRSFQEYIKSLCNPELKISVPFSEQFYNVLFKLRDDLERTTSAVVKFPTRNKCSLQGSAVAVTMAQSSIEDKLTSSPPRLPSIEPQLREFAIKLGYSNQVIDQAVQKLGTNVTQNTLLNELLKTTASLPYQISASTPQPKPAPAIAQYPPRRDIIARGAPNTPPSHMLRAGYENPPDKMIVRGPMHGVQQGWERDIVPRGASAAMPRPSYEMPGDVQVPRGTKRVLERPADVIPKGSSSVQPLMHRQPYSNQASSMYDNHREAGSSSMSASDRLDEQEQQMYQQILGAKKVAGNSSSNLRPVVIDGSNVAMR